MEPINKKNVFFQYIDRLNTPLEVFILQESDTSTGVGPHWHYYLEMLYVLHGELKAQCDNDFYILHPGDLILFYPQAVHSMHRAPDYTGEVHYFVIMIDLNFLNITNEYRTRFSKLFRIESRLYSLPPPQTAGTADLTASHAQSRGEAPARLRL